MAGTQEEELDMRICEGEGISHHVRDKKRAFKTNNDELVMMTIEEGEQQSKKQCRVAAGKEHFCFECQPNPDIFNCKPKDNDSIKLIPSESVMNKHENVKSVKSDHDSYEESEDDDHDMNERLGFDENYSVVLSSNHMFGNEAKMKEKKHNNEK